MSGIATAMVIASAIGAGVSASSASKQRKANKNNQEAFNDATIENEEEARALFDGFITDYNKSKEKLEDGLTLQQYMEHMVQALDNPVLTAAYRRARNGDWEQAQTWSDQATKQNISAFNLAVDDLSGGDYKKLVSARNKAALGEDVDSLYSEAQRLRNPKIPEGSVKKDDEGNVIGGQRADKFEFGVSTTAIKEANDRSFAKTRTAIEDDRVAAQRQQDKAINFLPFLNYSEFTANNVVRPFEQNQLAAQLATLQLEAGLASNAMGAATGAPSPPPVISTAAADAATAQYTQAAIGALASMYKQNQSTTGTTNPSRADAYPETTAFNQKMNSGNIYAGS